MTLDKITFTDNQSIKGREDNFLSVSLRVDAVIESWQLSVFSYEWLANGKIKAAEDLSESEQEKRTAAEALIKSENSIPRPVLGIGMQDNIEIGAGRAELLTLAAHGLEIVSVHIPRGNESDFKAFLADVD